MTETLYKVLDGNGHSCNGGSAKWFLPHGSRLGKWMPAIANPVPCRRGYHVCRLDQLLAWLNVRVFEVEIRGGTVGDVNKIVAEQARLIRETAWNNRAAHHFAADCAERALRREQRQGRNPDRRSWSAAKAARQSADGLITEMELSAAWAAGAAAAAESAWAAESGAAWAAAAWAAAESAASAGNNYNTHPLTIAVQQYKEAHP